MMNSVYGFCGATRGMLPCVEIAAAVTSTGRNMIDHSKRMVESHYQGSQVIYGVSNLTKLAFYLGLSFPHLPS